MVVACCICMVSEGLADTFEQNPKEGASLLNFSIAAKSVTNMNISAKLTPKNTKANNSANTTGVLRQLQP